MTVRSDGDRETIRRSGHRTLAAVALGVIVACLAQSPPCTARTVESFASAVTAVFPKATEIEAAREGSPVRRVYQIRELLGYVFESDAYSNLRGFSGKPIKLLVGIDPLGSYVGVRVLEHHEPVFLHGLGEAPLFEFVSQYAGYSLRDRIIIDTEGGAGPRETGPVHFNAVTKATVSVMIINDVILTSAMQAARSTLEGFFQGPPARIKTSFFTPLDWPGLISAGYVKPWRISHSAITRAAGRPLEDYPEWRAQGALTEFFFDSYVAQVNVPVIGMNLLGKPEYQRLMDGLRPGEQAFMVMSSGPYSHVSPKFKPGTSPDRLGLEQNRLPIDIRDISFFHYVEPNLGDGSPEFDSVNVFRVKANAGFNPGEPARFSLGVVLRLNHLVGERVTFDLNYVLPRQLIEQIPVSTAEQTVRTPVWHAIWKSRRVEVGVLIVALTSLSLIFVRQHQLARRPRLLHGVRWTYLLFTLVFIGLYAQGQLSIVNVFTLLLNLAEGFDISLYLLDPALFVLWSFTFVTLFLWGRGVFCGWLCPFGALQEFLALFARWLRIRQIRLNYSVHRVAQFIKYPIFLVLTATAFYSLTAAELMVEIEPFKTVMTLFFVRDWPFVVYAGLLLAMGLFIHKFYCRYLCPLGAGLAILGKLQIFKWLTRIGLCGSPCQTCRRRCEIDSIRPDGRINDEECIQCLECIAVLQDNRQCVDRLLKAKNKTVRAITTGHSRDHRPMDKQFSSKPGLR